MNDLNDTKGLILESMAETAEKAWRALSGYKFWMFGYHASAWVKYNQLLPLTERQANPFQELVKLARKK